MSHISSIHYPKLQFQIYICMLLRIISSVVHALLRFVNYLFNFSAKNLHMSYYIYLMTSNYMSLHNLKEF